MNPSKIVFTQSYNLTLALPGSYDPPLAISASCQGSDPNATIFVDASSGPGNTSAQTTGAITLTVPVTVQAFCPGFKTKKIQFTPQQNPNPSFSIQLTPR